MTCNVVVDTQQTQRSVPPKSFEETKPIATLPVPSVQALGFLAHLNN